MKLKSILFVAAVMATVAASADNVILMSTGRFQNVNNCWAHAGAFMAESVYENASHKMVITEIGEDLQTMNAYHRLMTVYKNKIKFTMGDIADDGGFVSEYMDVLKNYGLLVRQSGESEGEIEYKYPAKADFSYFKTDRVHKFKADFDQLQDKLLAEPQPTPEEAEKMIRLAVFGNSETGVPVETILAGEKIQRTQLFEKLIRPELRPVNPIDPVVIYVTSQELYPELTVGFLKQDTLDIFVVPKTQDILNLAQFSLDRGFPASYETTDHAMTFLGYAVTNGVTYYAVANSNSNIAWTSHINSVYGSPFDSSSIFYNVIKDELKKFLPFSMLNNRTRRVSGIFKLKK